MRWAGGLHDAQAGDSNPAWFDHPGRPQGADSRSGRGLEGRWHQVALRHGRSQGAGGDGRDLPLNREAGRSGSQVPIPVARLGYGARGGWCRRWPDSDVLAADTEHELLADRERGSRRLNPEAVGAEQERDAEAGDDRASEAGGALPGQAVPDRPDRRARQKGQGHRRTAGGERLARNVARRRAGCQSPTRPQERPPLRVFQISPLALFTVADSAPPSRISTRSSDVGAGRTDQPSAE